MTVYSFIQEFHEFKKPVLRVLEFDGMCIYFANVFFPA